MTLDPKQFPPPMPKDLNYVPPERDPNRPGPHIVAEIMPLEGQLKVGHVQGFTVRCDESERVGGTARYARAGSVLAGDAQTRCDSIATELSLDSSEPLERLAQLITMAEATCFTMAALRHPAPVKLEATVNGQPFNPKMAGSA